MEGIQTTLDDNYHYQDDHPNQEDSQTTSTSNSSYDIINNLSEKMKLLTGPNDEGFGRATTRRKTTRKRVVTTKKKMTLFVMDENTFLEENDNINISLLGNLSESRILMENIETSELYREIKPRMLENYDKVFQLLANKEKMETLGNALRSFVKPTVNDIHYNNDYDANHMLQPDEDFHETQEYTVSHNHELPSTIFNPEMKENIEKLKLLTGTTDLREITKKEKRKIGNVFYDMLCLYQHGDINLDQDNPENFSPIFVTPLLE